MEHKEHQEISEHHHSKKGAEDDEIEIDFSKIKSWFKKAADDSGQEQGPKQQDNKKSAETKDASSISVEKKKEAAAEKQEEPQKKESDDDDIVIDFGKITSFFKGSEESKWQKAATASSSGSKKEEVEKKDDEITIDFSGMKSKFKGMFSGETQAKEKREDEIAVDWSKVGSFFKTYGIFFLALIPIVLSIHVRMVAGGLPITDQWAQDSVINSIKSQISSQIAQQYPNLPEANRNALVDAELKKQLEQYWPQIQQQIQGTSNYFKDHFKDPNGIPYMPDIDTYYWMRYAENVLDHGYAGDEMRNGVQWDTLQLAPIGRPVFPDTFPSYFIAYFHSFLKAFNSKLTLVQTMSLYPVVISAIATLLVFLIALKVSNGIGASFAGAMFAINTSFLGRSLYGHADNDAWVLFFPLLITWLFFEMFEKDKLWKVVAIGAIAGALIGVFTYAWAGGWWFIFDLIIGMICVLFLYLLIRDFSILKKEKFAFFKGKDELHLIVGVAAFVVAAAISVSFARSFESFLGVAFGPLSFTTIKSPVQASLWPNVLTTVAELNTGSFNQAMSSVGGKFLFYVGVLGILLAVFKKDKEGRNDIRFAILLGLWFAATCYATLKGIRFTLLLAPAYAVAFGTAMGILYSLFSKWLSKELHVHRTISTVLLIVLFSVLLIGPVKSAYGVARSDLPIVNDVWWNSLKVIENNSSKNAIITSWWDFGHHFKQIAKRPVTFDGTTQTFPAAHWVGKMLMVHDETQAIGILSMLDCGGEIEAFDLINKKENNAAKSIGIIDKINVGSKTAAEGILKKEGFSMQEIDTITALTHCAPPEGFVIASNDMVGKSGVWSHFGSWNFERADVWYNVRPKQLEEGVAYMMGKYNYSREKAESVYYEVSAIPTEEEGNRWVAPWPGYAGTASCSRQSENSSLFTCSNGFTFNYTNKDAYAFSQGSLVHPKVIAYATKDGVDIREFKENSIDMGITFIPENRDSFTAIVSSPELAGGMFTIMFYMDGHGLQYFEPFYKEKGLIGTEVKVYKANWGGGDPHIEQKYVDALNQIENITVTA